MNRRLISMPVKPVLFVALITVQVVQLVSAQDFTIKIKDQEDGNIVATHYVGRNAVRNVRTSPADADLIYRLDRGTIITVDNKHKTYSESTLAEAKQIAAQKENAMSPQQKELMKRMGYGNATITKLGPGETIAGYTTEKYAVKSTTYQGEIWVAPALETPPGYYDMVTAYVGSAAGGIGWVMKQLREKQIQGYLLKSTGTVSFNPMMKGISVTEVASSIDKHPIPASTFDPPAGYRKVEHPY